MNETGGQGTKQYGWDAVNRMVSRSVGANVSSYVYRADGMRVRKVVNGVTERIFHDGQMPLETDSQGTVTRNFVGARGIEAMETSTSTSSNTAYPLYDTHGNMVATVAKDTAGNSWQTGNIRQYDVWGSLRQGASTGDPKGRYCANLGHVQDDESGLVYMRARYYEPGTGRFISEDPARDGENWYEYAKNRPVEYRDYSGKTAELDDYLGKMLKYIVLGVLVSAIKEMTDQYSSTGSVSNPGRIIGKVAKGALLAPIFAILGAAWIETAKAALVTTLTGPEKFGAVFAILSYTVVLAMFVAMTDLAFDELIDSIAGEN